MEQKRNITIILAALALVLVGCLLLIAELTGWRPEAGQSQQQAAGETPIPYAEGAAFDVASAPDFAFAGSDGAFASLYDHLGTPILVHFWNGDGDAVVEELHALDRAFANYGEDVQFLIIIQQASSRKTKQNRSFHAKSSSCLCFSMRMAARWTPAARCSRRSPILSMRKGLSPPPRRAASMKIRCPSGFLCSTAPGRMRRRRHLRPPQLHHQNRRQHECAAQEFSWPHGFMEQQRRKQNGKDGLHAHQQRGHRRRHVPLPEHLERIGDPAGEHAYKGDWLPSGKDIRHAGRSTVSIGNRPSSPATRNCRQDMRRQSTRDEKRSMTRICTEKQTAQPIR